MYENRPGGEYITRYEAEKLMTQMLKDYEKEVVAPRHEETQGALAETNKSQKETQAAVTTIKNLVEQGKGMKLLAGLVVPLCTVVLVILSIVQAMKK